MQKKYRFISAAVASLMAVAPLATAPIVALADPIAVTPGSNDNLETTDLKIKLAVKNAYALTNGQSVSDIQTDLSSNIGKVTMLSSGNAYVVKASSTITDAASAKAAAVKDVKAGESYVVVITDAGIQGLGRSKEYNVTIGDTQSRKVSSDDFGTISSLGMIKSSTFTVPDSSINGSPYFTSHNSNTVITSSTLNLDINNVNNMVNTIKNNIDAHGGDARNTAYETDLVQDFTSQLQAQNIKVNVDGSFTPKENRLSVNYIVHFANGKTAILPITFNVDKNAVDPTSPIISINDSSKVKGQNGSYTYTDLSVNSNTTAQDIAKTFTARVSKDDATVIPVTVQSSTLNTAIPGVYTVVLTAKNNAGKISTAVVSVTVRTNSGSTSTAATNMTVQYEAGESVPVYKLENNKLVKSGLEIKNGSVITTFGTQIIDNVSYTKVINDSGTMFVQTKYLDGSYQKQTRTNRKVMHASWIYDETGKRKNEAVIRAYSKITTIGEPVKIDQAIFYKVGQDQYIKAGNIDGTRRLLKKKAYIYNSKGRAIKTSKGNKFTIKKGDIITTYGAHFTINGYKFYRVGKGQYIRTANFGKSVAVKDLVGQINSKSIANGK